MHSIESELKYYLFKMKIINSILELTAQNLHEISCSVLGSYLAQALTQSSSKTSLNGNIWIYFSATTK